MLAAWLVWLGWWLFVLLTPLGSVWVAWVVTRRAIEAFWRARLERRIRRAILRAFATADAAPGGRRMGDPVTVRAGFVALGLMGLPADTAPRKLPDEDLELYHRLERRVVEVGDALVARGLLRPFNGAAYAVGLEHPVLPPRGVYLLTPAGRRAAERHEKAVS